MFLLHGEDVFTFHNIMHSLNTSNTLGGRILLKLILESFLCCSHGLIATIIIITLREVNNIEQSLSRISLPLVIAHSPFHLAHDIEVPFRHTHTNIAPVLFQS